MADGDLTTVVNCDLPANNQRRAATFNDTFSATPVWIDFRSLKGSDLSGTPFRPSGVHIDNTLGSGDLTINFGAIGYRIVCPANAMLNLPYPAPISDMVSVIGAGQATLIFVDYPVEPFLKEGTMTQTLWGQIGGTLSNQSDLQTVLNTKITNPMTAVGDLMIGGTAGAPARLAGGSENDRLTMIGGVPTWHAQGFTNPMTTVGDMITGGAAGTPQRLPVGTNGQFLSITSGAQQWRALTKTDINLTSAGDLLYIDGSGNMARLPIGGSNQRLTVSAGLPIWQTQGFTNPMTTLGDLIVGSGGGNPARLGIGTTGQVLTVQSGTSSWMTPQVAWGNITGTLSTQTDLSNALNLKAPLASPTFTGTVNGITATMVGLGNVNNTSDVNKPVSTAQQAALDLKVTNPMTSVGDLIVGGTAGAPTRLAEGAAGSFLSSDTTTPVWRAMIGTVSQSSGTPTGAIFERNSNSNGDYVKFADGTMICTSANISLTTASIPANSFSTFSTFTMPATFINNTFVVYATPLANGSNDFYGVTYAEPASTSTISVNIRNGASAQSFGVKFIAIGRWF